MQPDWAPHTVQRFLMLCATGSYEHTAFHCLVKGSCLEHGIEGRFRLHSRVEGQGPLAQTVRPWVPPVQPGVRVRDSPCQNRFQRLPRKDALQEITVNLRDRGISFRDIPRQFGESRYSRPQSVLQCRMDSTDTPTAPGRSPFNLRQAVSFAARKKIDFKLTHYPLPGLVDLSTNAYCILDGSQFRPVHVFGSSVKAIDPAPSRIAFNAL